VKKFNRSKLPPIQKKPLKEYMDYIKMIFRETKHLLSSNQILIDNLKVIHQKRNILSVLFINSITIKNYEFFFTYIY
jgi:hypothetical protein